MEPTFEHEESNAKGAIMMLVDGSVVARMTYSRIDAGNIIIDHTAVDPNRKGTGAGKAIVMHMVDWARQENQKVLPLCPFTKGVIERYPETHDILRS